MLKDSIPTILNKQKLPSFMRFYPEYETKYKKSIALPEPRQYTYMKKPPSLRSILESTEDVDKS